MSLSIVRSNSRSKTSVENQNNTILKQLVLPAIEQVLEELDGHSADINEFVKKRNTLGINSLFHKWSNHGIWVFYNCVELFIECP